MGDGTAAAGEIRVFSTDMTIGLLLTSLALGLRHGIDWDHIAAIADLSSTAENRRHGFLLSLLYALGHALVVIVLGVAAILFGAALPRGTDVWMGRVVGVTLVALGAWVLIELFRKGRDFRLRSRWILVISGTFAGLRRVRQANARRRLLIEHDHEHEHDNGDHGFADPGSADRAALDHRLPQAHDHDHLLERSPLAESADDLDSRRPVMRPGASGIAGSTSVDGSTPGPRTGFGPGLRLGSRPRLGHRHTHRHRHETVLAEAATVNGNGTAAGIGLLHGVGFESPTQIAVFVASTSVVGPWSGLGLLAAWVLGLLLANSMLAGLAGLGLLGADRNFKVYATVAAVVGVSSLAMGITMLTGIQSVLVEL